MKKILIADLFGTLIPRTIINADYLYGRGVKRKELREICNDKEYYNHLLDDIYIQMIKSMSEFLKEGNELKIVSGVDNHEGLDYTVGEMLPRLYKYLKEYRDKIEIFLVDEDNTGFNNEKYPMVTFIKEENGIPIYNYDNMFNFSFIKNKTDVFDTLTKEYNLYDIELYSIGDSDRDFDMLIKCLMIGGKSSFIKGNLYTYDQNLMKTTDDIILDKINMDYNIMIEDIILKEYPNYSILSEEDRRNIKRKIKRIYGFGKYYNEHLEEFYDKLKNGELDLDEMIKEREIYNLIEWYYESYATLKTYHENNAEKLDLYPNFQDYYNRVLVKK